MESVALLFDDPIDGDPLAGRQPTLDSALEWDGIIASTPVDVRKVDVTLHGEVIDGRKWCAMIVGAELFTINKDLEFLVVRTNANVELVAFFDRILVHVLFAPLSVLHCVQNNLIFSADEASLLVETHGDVERAIAIREITPAEEIYLELRCIFRVRAISALDREGLPGLDPLLETAFVGNLISLLVRHGCLS